MTKTEEYDSMAKSYPPSGQKHVHVNEDEPIHMSQPFADAYQEEYQGHTALDTKWHKVKHKFLRGDTR